MKLVRVLLFGICMIGIIFGLDPVVLAMSSVNYTVQSDSINSGGADTATSTNYSFRDTVGEQATGDTTSTNYQTSAGYRSGDNVLPPPPVQGSQGGGGASGGVQSAPVISNVQTQGITQTEVTITWTTNVNSDSSVLYGHTVSYASGTLSAVAQVVNHSITVSGLLPRSLYHFKVASTDSSTLLLSGSTDLTFSTLGDISPPVISNIQVTDITEDSAIIHWTSDELATTDISYGTSASYGMVASASGYATNHLIELTSLLPNTSYHYRIETVDESGNVAMSEDALFTTNPDVTPPPNLTSLEATPGDGRVALRWSVPNTPDIVGVAINRKSSSFPSGPNDGSRIYEDAAVGFRFSTGTYLFYRAALSVATSFVDTNVINGTTYYYGLYAYDASGNFSSGSLVSATPNGPISVEPPSVEEVSPTVPPVAPPTETPTQQPSSESTPIEPVVLPPGASAAPGSPSSGSGGGSAIIRGEVNALFSSLTGVQLAITSTNQVGVIPGTTVQVQVPVSDIQATTKAGFVAIQGALFSLQLNTDGTAYTGNFVVPLSVQSDVTVSVQLEDGSFLAHTYTFVSQQGVRVQGQTITGIAGTGIPDAKVTIYRQEGGIEQVFAEALFTRADGSLEVYVPNGLYRIEAKTEDSLKSISDTFEVRLNVPNVVLKLITPPQPIVLRADASATEQTTVAVQQAIQDVVYIAQVARSILEKPIVQQVNTLAAPIALTISVVSAASSLSLFSVLALLQNLLTQPLLLVGRKKRKRWGVIYNSLTKQPIELAIVRLIHADTGHVVQSKVTDKLGRYWFPASKGNYLIEVVKPGFIFPSQYLANENEDVELVDLYHSSRIELAEDDILAKNVPLDPSLREETPKQVLFKSAMQKVKYSASLGSVILGVAVLCISPSSLTVALSVAQIAAFALFRRLGMPVKAKNWGYTFDQKTNKPISRVIVRIFDKRFNKLLETQVTDNKGKFGFFVKENVYYVTTNKDGYEHYISEDIDLRGKKDAAISHNIPLVSKSLIHRISTS